ncbi:MAG: sigma-54-dependent Fis family transcriptional regulator [Nitrospira sp.]|nr:sigma-54-dependent Fis family transcriptional regulator [Nitrospira sp.]
MSQSHILVIDDDPAVRQLLAETLTGEGYQVTVMSSGLEGVEAVKDQPVHVVLTDLQMPGIDGLETIDRISKIDSKIIAIVMTGYGTIDYAVRAMKAGAFDFITKPFEPDTVTVVVRKALDVYKLKQENHLLRKAVRDQYRLEHLVGNSAPMRMVLDFVEKVADSDSTVLIEGESGTGKELIARMLHFNSMRRERPLVPVNCGAIPETLLESELFGHEKGAFTGAAHTRLGQFELAHGVTIFLDEVGEMSLPLQVKLLRVLQERCFERVGGTRTINVDVRIIAATNQDLALAVQERRFRQDLYYRLHVIPIHIPPLRERRSDIPLLVTHFISQFNQLRRTEILGMEPDALARMTEEEWPGNIRELENMVERLCVLKKRGMITLADLPERAVKTAAGKSVEAPEQFIRFTEDGINLTKELEHYENRLIGEALRKANGITSRAAQLLQVNRTTLVEKLKRKGFDPKSHGYSIQN